MLNVISSAKLTPRLHRSEPAAVPLMPLALPSISKPATVATIRLAQHPPASGDLDLLLPDTHTSLPDSGNSGCSHIRSNNRLSYSRRGLLLKLAATGATAAAAGAIGPSQRPAVALPLGPLGPVKRVGGEKRTGLPAEDVAEILRHDLAEGQYFVTGKLTREIFADDCRFVDPTNDVTGLSKYLTALGVLFDPQYSKVELLDIRVVGPRQVEADWRLGGYLVFPWRPLVQPFTGHTVYTLNESGLVSEQRQTWSISAATALLESFTPSWGPRKQLF